MLAIHFKTANLGTFHTFLSNDCKTYGDRRHGSHCICLGQLLFLFFNGIAVVTEALRFGGTFSDTRSLKCLADP